MRGLLLTGPTGVGKSTVQTRLRDDHGFWVPHTCTTRIVDSTDSDLLHVPEAEFLQAVHRGEIVVPACFGGIWYGWRNSDVKRMRTDDGRAVLNVRPYTALILQALLDEFTAVWLTLEPNELLRRRSGRQAPRDTNDRLRRQRESQDDDDLVYRPCFGHVYIADDDLLSKLLNLKP